MWLLLADADVVAMQDKMVPEQVGKMMMKKAVDDQRTRLDHLQTMDEALCQC